MTFLLFMAVIFGGCHSNKISIIINDRDKNKLFELIEQEIESYNVKEQFIKLKNSSAEQLKNIGEKVCNGRFIVYIDNDFLFELPIYYEDLAMINHCPHVLCNYRGFRIENNNVLSIKNVPPQEKDSLLKFYTAMGFQNVDSLIESGQKNIETELINCEETNRKRFDKRLER